VAAADQAVATQAVAMKSVSLDRATLRVVMAELAAVAATRTLRAQA
jgi:hypothetical protein